MLAAIEIGTARSALINSDLLFLQKKDLHFVNNSDDFIFLNIVKPNSFYNREFMGIWFDFSLP